MSLTLYSYYRSSCSYRVRIGLYFKNLDFKYQPVHLIKKGGEQFTDSFKKLNPLSQVPCLKHGDKILTQSLPILFYLEDLQANPPLLPATAFEKAQILSFCEMINSGIQPLQNFSVLSYLEKGGLIHKKDWSQYWIKKGLQACEQFLQKTAGSFCFANQLTLADLFLVPQIYNACRFKLDMSDFPLLQKINKNCLKQACFQKAHPENQPDQPA